MSSWMIFVMSFQWLRSLFDAHSKTSTWILYKTKLYYRQVPT